VGFALLAVLGTSACSDPAQPTPASEDVAMPFLAVFNAFSGVATVVVTVTGPRISTPIVGNFPIVNDTARGTLTLPVGPGRVLTAEAFDASGLATYRGTRTVTVAAGTNAGVALTLLPLLGDVPVTAVVGRLTLTLSAAPTTLAAGTTSTLTAEVRDAQNALVSVPVTYALSRPPAASVTAGGILTALDTGTVQVTATAFGSAATTTITMTPGVVLDRVTMTDTLRALGASSNADVVVTHPTGIDSVQVTLSPPAGGGAPVTCSSLTPATGTRTAGTFRCALTVPAGGTLGVWRVSLVRVFVGATPAVLDSESLRNRGVTASVRIIAL
jgi:hypothetical protein